MSKRVFLLEIWIFGMSKRVFLLKIQTCFTPGGGLETGGTIECRNRNKVKQNNVRSSPGGGGVQTLTHGAVYKTIKTVHHPKRRSSIKWPWETGFPADSPIS